MKLFSAILFLIFSVLMSGCSIQLDESALAELRSNPPMDKEVEAAMQFIEKAPDSPIGYTQLASVYIRQARETGDFALNSRAESAVQKALAIDPKDVPALKLQATLHLTFHRFGEGLILGNELLKDFPDDAFVYGILTDANAELGNYAAAVESAQKMVDLKPNSQSYARVAHLRSLHGQHEGAVEMYKVAARTADPKDKEAQSWCLTQLGNEFWRYGKYSEAIKAFDEALQNFPGYHLALVGKGRALAGLGDLAGAERILTDARNSVASPETIILLGDVYTARGETDKAREQYDLVQAGEEKLGELHDEHRLALFWADHDMNIDQALEIARQDHAEIKDIYASDILAWCLYKKGRYAEAKELITEAMRIGTKDARIFYHAGMIEAALGNRGEAKRLLRAAVSLNPQFDLVQAPKAHEAIGSKI